MYVLESKQCCNMRFLLSSTTNTATRTSAICMYVFRQHLRVGREARISVTLLYIYIYIYINIYTYMYSCWYAYGELALSTLLPIHVLALHFFHPWGPSVCAAVDSRGHAEGPRAQRTHFVFEIAAQGQLPLKGSCRTRACAVAFLLSLPLKDNCRSGQLLQRSACISF